MNNKIKTETQSHNVPESQKVGRETDTSSEVKLVLSNGNGISLEAEQEASDGSRNTHLAEPFRWLRWSHSEGLSGMVRYICGACFSTEIGTKGTSSNSTTGTRKADSDSEIRES